MGHVTMNELGRLLGVPSRQIRHAHERGFLPEPHRVGGSRTYDLGEVVRVAGYFGLKVLDTEVVEGE